MWIFTEGLHPFDEKGYTPCLKSRVILSLRKGVTAISIKGVALFVKGV